MVYDVQVLVQSLLYFVTSILGLVLAIPLGVTIIEFNNNCILYTKWTWVNSTYYTIELTNHNVCNFPVYIGVFTCILYGLAMGIYHAYAALKSKDPNIGYHMWIMPFLLINTLTTILIFISCCVISMGMKSLCDSIEDGQKKGAAIKSCLNAVDFNWNKYAKTNYRYSHFYSFPKASESAGWVAFFVWAAQLALCIVRFVRNRRLRSMDMEPEPVSPTTGRGSNAPPSDLENFAAVQPSA